MFKIISILFLLALTLFFIIYERIQTKKVIQRKLEEKDYGLTRTPFTGSINLGVPASDKKEYPSKLETRDSLHENGANKD